MHRYGCKNLFFIVVTVLFQGCFLDEGSLPGPERKYIENPSEKPVYVLGRLPGEDWREHRPAQFNVEQSFESRDLTKTLLLFDYHESRQSLKEFTLGYLGRLQQNDGVEASDEGYLDSPEGRWKKIRLNAPEYISRFYIIKKADMIFMIQFIAPDVESFALRAPQVEKFIKNLWLLYR